MLPTTIGIKTSGALAWLDASAAASYARMFEAGCPAGGITDAGRTNAEQWDMWWDYRAGKLKATAAYPGTSKHETGLALDLAGAALAWVRAHGAPYGWIKDRVANEPWHVEYQAARDTKGKTPAPRKAPTMRIICNPEQAERWITDGVSKRWITDASQMPDLLRLCDQAEPMVLGRFVTDRIPNSPDVAAIAAAVVKALPASAGGDVTLAGVTAAVDAALAKLTLKSV